MKPSLALILFAVMFCSCKQNAGTLLQFDKMEWQVVDSTTCYFISKKSSQKLGLTDSVSISFVGTLNNKTLTANSRIDSITCTQLLKFNFGTYVITDQRLSKEFETIIRQLTKNAEAFVKYQQDTTSLANKVVNNKISLFFKADLDSSSAVQWLQKIRSAAYTDSLKYTSANEALKAFGKDADWKPVFDANPLPSLADVYIKPIYCNQKSLDSIKSILLNYKFIAEITLPDFMIDKEIEAFKAISRTPFIIKFKT